MELKDIINKTKEAAQKADFYTNLKSGYFSGASFQILFSFILILILIFFFIRPTVLKIWELSVRLESLESLDKTLGDKIAIFQSLITKYDELKSYVTRTDFAVPLDHEFPTLEKQIRYLVQKNNLDLQSFNTSGFSVVGDKIKISDKQEPVQLSYAAQEAETIFKDIADYHNLSLVINISGNYEDIKNFLSQLKLLLRLKTINKVSLQKSKSGKSIDSVDMQIYLEFYYLTLKK